MSTIDHPCLGARIETYAISSPASHASAGRRQVRGLEALRARQAAMATLRRGPTMPRLVERDLEVVLALDELLQRALTNQLSPPCRSNSHASRELG
jgi:hypothetical protein